MRGREGATAAHLDRWTVFAGRLSGEEGQMRVNPSDDCNGRFLVSINDEERRGLWPKLAVRIVDCLTLGTLR